MEDYSKLMEYFFVIPVTIIKHKLDSTNTILTLNLSDRILNKIKLIENITEHNTLLVE